MERILKILTVSPQKTTDKLTERLGTWISNHSKCGEWLSYEDKNGNFYARETYEDKEWIIYKRTSKGTQLTCIDTIQKYQQTKHSTPVRIHASARRIVYRELGVELKIDNELIVGPVEPFQQLLAEQPTWIRNLFFLVHIHFVYGLCVD